MVKGKYTVPFKKDLCWALNRTNGVSAGGILGRSWRKKKG